MKPSRRGMITIMMLFVLMVSASLVISLARRSLQVHAASQQQQLAAQAEWLAAAARSRAQARLAKSDDYTGETWTIPADQLGGRRTAAIDIAVVDDPDQTQARALRVEVVYGPEQQERVQLTRTYTAHSPADD